jgi:hypothetical protein
MLYYPTSARIVLKSLATYSNRILSQHGVTQIGTGHNASFYYIFAIVVLVTSAWLAFTL